MNRSRFFALSLTGALALVSAPAFAQHHRGGGDEHRDNAAPRTERRESQPQQQAQAQPRQQEQRQEQRAAPRQQEQRQEQRAAPRQQQRQEQRAEPRRDSREYRGQYSTPRYNYNYNAPRYSGRYYGSRYSGPRFSYAPRRFYRPYYVFRPRFSLGFGIWAGYPITYYDPYYSPYDYSYSGSPVGPSYPQGSVGVQPGVQGNQANMGGLSFDITPNTAELYVDGQYFGDVGQYTSSSQPLGLPAGRHHIELREPGYEVSSFDVDIVAGQVIPYQGQLQQ